VIGRADDCAVAIDFTGVSRRHATIHISGGGVTLEDLGSKNGTWLNGERLFAPAELHDGDRIRLGAAALTFRSTARTTRTSTLNAPARDSSSGRR
jgi:pSer/pThr/pTyr-binding forkhead associated (FHA) protein